MNLSFTASTRPSIHGQLKQALLFKMSERDFEARIRDLEGKELFRRLIDLGVVSAQPYPNARFAARRFAGRELSASAEGLSDLLDGRGELVSLMGRIGQERFEECFLRDDGLADEERARRCGISAADARRLREFVDRLYVQEEFEAPSTPAAPARVYSAVASVELENGKPILGFFGRDIWKGRYRIDERRREEVLGALGGKEASRAQRLLAELEHVERRKSTLYRLLELLIEAQAAYLAGGDPGLRRPLTQKAVAARLEIAPSVLNRLISNKSVQLPWGLQAPLKVFMPSSKLLARDRLHDLALAEPELSDGGLRREMRRVHGVALSRRSISQYRKELGLAIRGLRAAAGSGPLGATSVEAA